MKRVDLVDFAAGAELVDARAKLLVMGAREIVVRKESDDDYRGCRMVFADWVVRFGQRWVPVHVSLVETQAWRRMSLDWKNAQRASGPGEAVRLVATCYATRDIREIGMVAEKCRREGRDDLLPVCEERIAEARRVLRAMN